MGELKDFGNRVSRPLQRGIADLEDACKRRAPLQNGSTVIGESGHEGDSAKTRKRSIGGRNYPESKINVRTLSDKLDTDSINDAEINEIEFVENGRHGGQIYGVSAGGGSGRFGAELPDIRKSDWVNIGCSDGQTSRGPIEKEGTNLCELRGGI